MNTVHTAIIITYVFRLFLASGGYESETLLIGDRSQDPPACLRGRRRGYKSR